MFILFSKDYNTYKSSIKNKLIIIIFVKTKIQNFNKEKRKKRKMNN